MIELRPYQARAITQLRAQYAAGHRAVVLVSPTGSGKTSCAAEIIRLAVVRSRVLFLAHRRELIAQTVATLARAGVTDVRVIRAQHDSGSGPRVTVASVQTITGESWDDRLPEADFIIVDEAHHVKARTWEALLGRYPGAKILGLTATPQRGDGEPLGDVFQALVVGATVKELTDLGHLVPCRAFSPSELLEPGKLAMTALEAYQRFGAGTGTPPPELLADPDPAARAVLRDWYEGNGWRRAVVFCDGIKHCEGVVAELTAGGVLAAVVHGKLRDRVRADILARFAAGELRAVVNDSCLTEGWDDPGCSLAILMRRFGHAGEFLQAGGRVLRPAVGKPDAILADLCGSVLEHGTPEAERRYTLDGVGIQRATDRDPITQCPTCGGVFPSARARADRDGKIRCPQCGAELPRKPRPEPRSTGAGVEDVTELAKQRSLRLLRNLRAAAAGGRYSDEWVKRAHATILERRFPWRAA